MSNDRNSAPSTELDVKSLATRVDSHGRRITKLEESQAGLAADLETLSSQVRSAIAASHRAANAAIEAQASVSTMRAEVTEQLQLQTREITRLLSNDRDQDAALERFGQFLDAATASAVRQIADETGRAGKKLSSRVTVPVGLIAAIATIVQWILTHYGR